MMMRTCKIHLNCTSKISAILTGTFGMKHIILKKREDRKTMFYGNFTTVAEGTEEFKCI